MSFGTKGYECYKSKKNLQNNFFIRSIKKFYNGTIGAYPNNGYFEKPNWKFIDNITSSKYLKEARSWVSSGAQIIGGCCGIGPDKIKAISILK